MRCPNRPTTDEVLPCCWQLVRQCVGGIRHHVSADCLPVWLTVFAAVWWFFLCVLRPIIYILLNWLDFEFLRYVWGPEVGGTAAGLQSQGEGEAANPPPTGAPGIQTLDLWICSPAFYPWATAPPPSCLVCCCLLPARGLRPGAAVSVSISDTVSVCHCRQLCQPARVTVWRWPPLCCSPCWPRWHRSGQRRSTQTTAHTGQYYSPVTVSMPIRLVPRFQKGSRSWVRWVQGLGPWWILDLARPFCRGTLETQDIRIVLCRKTSDVNR